jgi:hypothetical protein
MRVVVVVVVHSREIAAAPIRGEGIHGQKTNHKPRKNQTTKQWERTKSMVGKKWVSAVKQWVAEAHGKMGLVSTEWQCM